MKARYIVFALLASIIFLVGWTIVDRLSSQPEPIIPSWPTFELTPVQAEMFTDAIAALTNELEQDLKTNNGTNATRILSAWHVQAPHDIPQLASVFYSLDSIAQHGPITYQHLSSLWSLANQIDDASEAGVVIISSQIEQDTLVILVHNIGSKEPERIVLTL
jgi:hypothetical protein